MYIVGAFYDVNDNATYDQGEPSGGFPAPNGNPLYDFSASSQANITIAYSQAVTGDAQAVAADKASLQIAFAGTDSAAGVTNNITFPSSGTSGTAITWSSTNPTLISASGEVSRPATTTDVILVATISKGTVSDAKLFTVTVLSGILTDAEAVAADTAALEIGYSGGDIISSVIGNLTLATTGKNGTSIAWISSNENAVSVSGVVTRSTSSTTVVLTAMISKGSVLATKSFILTILSSTLTNAQSVAADKVTLQIIFAAGDSADGVTGDMTLPVSGANGSSISWSSDNTEVVSATGAVTKPASATTVNLTATIAKGIVTDTKLFQVTVLQAELTDVQAVAADKAALNVGFAAGDSVDGVTANLVLPTSGANGTAIVWTSSDATVISASGAVNRPTSRITVTLTATISKGSANGIQLFAVTVLPLTLSDAEAVAADKGALEIVFTGNETPTGVTGNITLPTLGTNGSAISWASSNPYAVDPTGMVFPQATMATVNLTASITRGNSSDTKVFSVTVLAAPMTDAQAVASDAADLQIGFASGDVASSVTTNLVLPTQGANATTIGWSSTHPLIVSEAGTVAQPDATTDVTLSATISKGTASETKNFTVTVLKVGMSDAEAVEADKAALQIGYSGSDYDLSVTGNLNLPTSGSSGSSIAWASSDPTIVAGTGVVTRPVATATVTLTATLTKVSANATKTFAVTVILAAPALATETGGLTVGSATGSSLAVAWTPVPGADGYQIYRNGSLRYNDIGTGFTDDFDVTQDLASGTTYSYSVRAVNASGSSALSTAVSGTTLKLVPPNFAVGSPSATSLTVSWTGVKGANGYAVFRDTSSTGTFPAPAVYSGSATSFNNLGLDPGSNYWYKIQATYPAGTGELSSAASGTTAVYGTVATPTFNPAAGTYTTAQSVTLACATSGAAIRYTTDGITLPTSTSGTIYNGAAAIAVSATTTIKAIAYLAGYTDSSVASATYTIQPPAATPTFSPAAGTYTSITNVSLASTTSGASIYYTTNGTTPTTSSALYSTSIALSASATIKAIAHKTGYTDSSVASAAYTILLPTATPTFSPVAGTYTSAKSVTISSTTSGATIRYTTNGVAPTSSSGTIYSSAIAVSATTTIKAIAYKTGYSDSSVATALYTINLPAIGLSPTSVSFSSNVGATTNPAAKTVAVSNSSGYGTLSGLVRTISYGSGSGWLAATLNTTTAPATLTLTATTGTLAAGVYTATVAISSSVASNSPQNVSVTFAVIPRTGLVGEWLLNGSSVDTGGSYTNNASNVGGATSTTDRNTTTNRAYSFNGTSQYLMITSANELAISSFETSGYTISGWIYLTSSAAGYKEIVSMGVSSFSLRVNGSGLEATHKADNGSTYLKSSATLSLNTWYHVAVTWNYSGGAWQIYLNGVAYGTSSTMTGLAPSTLGGVTIGGEDATSPARWFFPGKIDDVRIYSRALSAAEISALYNWD